jgi:ABC-2 type transport system ATP-binding protein
LDDVSFDLARGSVTALVGPNGAGKTTLLRCLAGLEPPVSGTIRIDGIDALGDPREAHRRLGFLQDFFGVYDRLSVARNLLYAATTQGVASADLVEAATAAARAVGIEDRLEQPAGTLSRGLRQRLAIARAIVHRPALLLMDEPASGLDPEARGELSGLIRRLAADGMTIVVSSHILAELEEYSTHMLAVRAGRTIGPRLIGTATPGGRRLVAGLIGDPEAARRVLAGLQGVSGLSDEKGGIAFDLVGDATAQRDVLRALVAAGVDIVSLAPAGLDLHHLYVEETAA